MDNFYKTLKERSSREKKKDASYSMVFGPLFNFLTKLGIWKTAEKGIKNKFSLLISRKLRLLGLERPC